MSKMNFVEQKKYFKERQVLYDRMKSINDCGVVEIGGEMFRRSTEEFATYIFIWFDRKPFVSNYSAKKSMYWIGNQQFQLRSAKQRSKVIAYVEKFSIQEQIENEYKYYTQFVKSI